MDVRLGAAVERRTTQLLEEAKRSYELAWHEFERSYEGAITRLEELFAAYEEFLVLHRRPRVPEVQGRDEADDRDLVFVFEAGSGGTRELVFRVGPLPPRAVVEFFESTGRDGLTASWGDPFG